MFNLFKEEISKQKPYLSQDDLHMETLKLVPHPKFPEDSYPVLPHNSGGAIDLTIEKDGELLDMGTKFDDISKYIDTDFFEKDCDGEMSASKWQEIRSNRRLLYKVMIEQGFTNHPNEWWHYNLGNCPWSELVKKSWVYGSGDEEFNEVSL